MGTAAALFPAPSSLLHSPTLCYPAFSTLPSTAQHEHSFCWQPEKQAVLLQEMLPTIHRKYGQFTLATAFGLLFWVSWCCEERETYRLHTVFSNSNGLPLLHPLCTERDSQRALQAARKERYQKQAFWRSHRKPLSAGEGRAN